MPKPYGAEDVVYDGGDVVVAGAVVAAPAKQYLAIKSAYDWSWTLVVLCAGAAMAEGDGRGLDWRRPDEGESSGEGRAWAWATGLGWGSSTGGWRGEDEFESGGVRGL